MVGNRPQPRTTEDSETVPSLTPREKVYEATVKWVFSRPLTFDEFLEEFGPKDFVELINGVAVEKTMVQLEHEKLLMWLNRLLGDYVEDRDLGIVLGSRTAVQINEFGGRLPDLLFVRRERFDIMQNKGLYSAPDLIIELISPNDRRSDLNALEADYRSLGVPEIIFIDQQKLKVRALRLRDTQYEEEILTTGTLRLEAIENLSLDLLWLFAEPRPAVRKILTQLLSGME